MLRPPVDLKVLIGSFDFSIEGRVVVLSPFGEGESKKLNFLVLGELLGESCIFIFKF